jgi:ParB family transcriptional regulator, chromosome partitioning protein
MSTVATGKNGKRNRRGKPEHRADQEHPAEGVDTENGAECQPLVIQPNSEPLSNPALVPNIVLVPLDRINVPDGRRPTDPAKVDSLAKSLEEVGLLQPIVLDPAGNLVCGAHRLAAARSLGWPTIPAITLHFDELHSELAQIDENLVRSKLTRAEMTKALARRKKIYELLHPEAVAGKAQAAGSNRAQGKGKDVSVKLSPTFTKDTAAKTGQSKRTVERLVEIGEKLDPEAAAQLKGTAIENNLSELKSLAEQPAEKQRELATQIQAGIIKSIRDTLWPASANSVEADNAELDDTDPGESAEADNLATDTSDNDVVTSEVMEAPEDTSDAAGALTGAEGDTGTAQDHEDTTIVPPATAKKRRTSSTKSHGDMPETLTHAAIIERFCELHKEMVPLATKIISDEFTIAERDSVHEKIGVGGMFRLSNLIGGLCSETSRRINREHLKAGRCPFHKENCPLGPIDELPSGLPQLRM